MIKKQIAFVAISLIIGVGLGCSRQQQRGPAPQNSGPGKAPAMDVSRLGKVSQVTVPVGSAAIKPANQSVPSFTVETAREYVMAHPFPAFAGGKGKKPTITRAEFLTSKQVKEILRGASTGFADDQLLCYVELKGPFTFSGPPNTSVTYPRGIMIFHAATGNFVMSGGIP
ncbi:MAG TPA: hypothetical protein VHW72_08050 [Candidatus Angelobacter sp.]|jgi:hypothetical protein|nr:hypothetical protein [Candidatus Angelobacter sp.]